MISIGHLGSSANTTGRSIIAIGRESLQSNTEGVDNIAIGLSSLKDNTIGMNNVAVGTGSMKNSLSAQYNVAIGVSALRNFISGSSMICIGTDAGYGDNPLNAPVTDESGILIGVAANRSVESATKLTNYIGIGTTVLIDKDNQVKIGNPSVDDLVIGSVLKVDSNKEIFAMGFDSLKKQHKRKRRYFYWPEIITG